MSARQQFFPQAPSRPESRAAQLAFTPDQTNPLNQKNPTNGIANKAENFASVQAAIDTSNANSEKNGLLKIRKTAGLAGLAKKKNQASGGNTGPTASENMVRPGTADPHSAMHRAGAFSTNISLMAPTPQKLNSLNTSTLLSRSGHGSASFSTPSHGFKTPSLDFLDNPAGITSKHAHISAMEAPPSLKRGSGQPDEPSGSTEHSRSEESSTGPRRIFVHPDPKAFNGETDHNFSSFSSVPGHEITEDGMVRRSNSHKRSRDEYEQDDNSLHYERQHPAKRLRGEQEDVDILRESSLPIARFSPLAERPSSGMSHTLNQRRSLSVMGSPHTDRASHTVQDRYNTRSPEQRSAYHGYDHQHSQFRPPQENQEESKALEDLLGQDPNAYVREHMDVYEGLVNKWTNCTMDEWSAGADEISSRFNDILDYVKDFVTAKLKLYSTLHKKIDDHDALLQRRNEVLDSVKKRLVEESGSVLGR
ncbi:hypothetical protein CPC08DRAFT_702900 [Agrocybe pediades]|nr:hypothetical protein CPC08DRAFT_702900 [Agrocybe pediades]